MFCYVMLVSTKMNIIFGIGTSTNVGISKFYAEKQAALHSLTFTLIWVTVQPVTCSFKKIYGKHNLDIPNHLFNHFINFVS